MAEVFTYLTSPDVSATASRSLASPTFDVTPAAGKIVDLYNNVAGARDLQLTGSDFFSGARVFLGGQECTGVVVVSSTVIECKVPPYPEDLTDLAVDVKVQNTDGGFVVLANGYAYLLSDPVIAAVTPAVGSSRGNRNVIISGTDLHPGLSLAFGGLLASSVVVADTTPIISSVTGTPTILTTTVPHGLLAADSVTIAGHSGSTPALNGTHTATPIDATHFSIPVTVTTGGTGGTVSIAPRTRITAKTPLHGTGESVEVRVTNIDHEFATSSYLYVYPDDALVVTNIGPVRRSGDALSITDELNDAPNTCSLTIGSADPVGDPATPPEAGQDVAVSVYGRLMFGGTIQTVTQIYEELATQLKWKCSLIDFTWELNGKRPFEVYTAVSASTIIADLISTYAPGFTTVNVAPSLGAVTMTFNGSLDLMACIVAVMQQINGYAYVDYERDVHAFITETSDPPETINDSDPYLLRDSPITLTKDISQVRNRVFVTWAGGTVQRDDGASQTLLGFTREETLNAPAEYDTLAKVQAFGDQWLAKFAKAKVEVNYATRDTKTRSGKTVPINLTHPPIVGDFLIQSVQIDQIHDDDETNPRLQVRASLVSSPVTSFGFMDLLRKVLLTPSGQGSVTFGGGGTTYAAGAGIAIAAGVISTSEAFIQADGGQAFTGDQSFGGHKATSAAAPTAGGDLANKTYVDAGDVAAAAAAPGAAHNLLSAKHSDTTTGSGVKGDLIVSDGTTWKKKAVGTDGKLLQADSAQADGLAWMSAASAAARVYRASAQTITEDAETAISFSNAEYDTDTFWSGGAATRLTIPSGKGGKYFILGQVGWAVFSGTGDVTLEIYVNGSLKAKSVANITGTTPTLQVSCQAQLSAADYIELKVIENEGGTTHDTVGGANATFLACALAAGVVYGGAGSSYTADDGIQIVSNAIGVKLDGASLAKSASGLKVAAAAGALVLLESHSASASAALDFITRNAPGQSGAIFQSDYDEYIIKLINVLPANNGAVLLLNVSTNGGSSWDTAGNYATAYHRWSKTGQSQGGGASAVNFEISGSLGVSNDATEQGLSGSLQFDNPLGTAGWKHLTGQTSFWYNGTPEMIGAVLACAYKSATGVNALRFAESAGNIASGIIRIYGVAK